MPLHWAEEMAKKNLEEDSLAYMFSRVRLKMKKELGSPTLAKQNRKTRQYWKQHQENDKTKHKFERAKRGFT